MLSVAVRRDDEALLRAVIQQIAHSLPHGVSLAAVGRVGNDVSDLILRNGTEQGLEFVAAAIVHHNDLAHPGRFQRLHVGGQTVVGLIGGNQQRTLPHQGCVHGIILSYCRFAQSGRDQRVQIVLEKGRKILTGIFGEKG